MLPTDKIEDMLADATSERMDTAEAQLNQLKLRLNSLQTRAEILLQKIQNRQVEIAEGEDHDMPVQKAEISSYQQEIGQLLQELSLEHSKQEPKLAEIYTKLETVETRIHSLEALFPGGAENN